MMADRHQIPSPRMGEGKGGGSRASDRRQFSLTAPTPPSPVPGEGDMTQVLES